MPLSANFLLRLLSHSLLNCLFVKTYRGCHFMNSATETNLQWDSSEKKSAFLYCVVEELQLCIFSFYTISRINVALCLGLFRLLVQFLRSFSTNQIKLDCSEFFLRIYEQPKVLASDTTLQGEKFAKRHDKSPGKSVFFSWAQHIFLQAAP